MTRFKVNLQEMQSLQKYKSFQEYLLNNTIDLMSWTTIDILEKEQSQSVVWNPFNSTTPNPLEVRLDSETDNMQVYTQGTKDIINNTVMSQVTNKKITKKTINANIWLSK